jgi:hypothetical protein
MSASSLLISPPTKAVMANIARLSREEKAVVAGLLQSEMDSEDFPQWQMDIVNERLQELDEGKTTAIPLEEAMTSLDLKWARKS